MSNHRVMMPAALLALSLTLLGCMKPLPEIEVLPVGPDPQVCRPIPKEPEPAGTVVSPVTEEERNATRDHLSSDVASRQWGREGWAIVAIAQRACVP